MSLRTLTSTSEIYEPILHDATISSVILLYFSILVLQAVSFQE
jgi:hypothetical protein